MNTSPGATRVLAVRFVTSIAQVLRGGMLVALGGSLAVALAEGAGLVLLVPLLGAIGLTVGEGPTTGLAQSIERAFAWFGLQPTLPTVLSLFVAVSLAHATLVRANSLIGPRLEQRYITSLRQRLYAALIGARWSFLAQQKSSDLVHAVTVDIERVSTATYQLFALTTAAAIDADLSRGGSQTLGRDDADGRSRRGPAALGNAKTDAGVGTIGGGLRSGEPRGHGRRGRVDDGTEGPEGARRRWAPCQRLRRAVAPLLGRVPRDAEVAGGFQVAARPGRCRTGEHRPAGRRRSLRPAWRRVAAPALHLRACRPSPGGGPADGAAPGHRAAVVCLGDVGDRPLRAGSGIPRPRSHGRPRTERRHPA